MTPLHAARHGFRGARQALAAAVREDDFDGAVAAARLLLRERDRFKTIVLSPSPREVRALRRWGHYAVIVLRTYPAMRAAWPAGLLDRAMQLNSNETG